MIWLLEIPEGISEQELQAYFPLLEEDRRRRLSKYKLERSRIESILAGMLLRCAYELECGGPLPEIVKGDHGKPGFADADAPRFNLSHCGLCRGEQCSLLQKRSGIVVACAISRHPVGVDVQELRRYGPKFRRILSESERAWIEEADSDRRFTALWTRKEAYGKALGCGIGYEMETTEFSGDCMAPIQWDGWLLWTVEGNGYDLSCCARERLQLQTLDTKELFRKLEEER